MKGGRMMLQTILDGLGKVFSIGIVLIIAIVLGLVGLVISIIFIAKGC